jgi:hypothetical protein
MYAVWITAFLLLTTLCAGLPAHAQTNGCAEFMYNVSSKCNGCQDEDVSYAFVGSGTIAWYYDIYYCCGYEPYTQWNYDGQCEIAGPEAKAGHVPEGAGEPSLAAAALDPATGQWHFVYVRTCEGKYELLKLPGA